MRKGHDQQIVDVICQHKKCKGVYGFLAGKYRVYM